MLLKFVRNILQKSVTRKKAVFKFAEIEKKLNYRFNNKDLLIQAFKHSSYLSITKENPCESNERLEFLGDAVLELVVTEYLYQCNPHTLEGELTKIKSVLVSRSALGEIVTSLDLGQYLLMDRGEEKTGGKERSSNLANLFEAIIGAIYLDGGLQEADKFIQNVLLTNYRDFINNKNYINYKSILLEFTQSEGLGNPFYQLHDESGPDHEKMFVMNVSVKGSATACGKGRSKKIAEQESARNLLKNIAPHLIESDD
jgi:ribonuclease-3